jgi:hypothetical protein
MYERKSALSTGGQILKDCFREAAAKACYSMLKYTVLGIR